MVFGKTIGQSDSFANAKLCIFPTRGGADARREGNSKRPKTKLSAIHGQLAHTKWLYVTENAKQGRGKFIHF